MLLLCFFFVWVQVCVCVRVAAFTVCVWCGRASGCAKKKKALPFSSKVGTLFARTSQQLLSTPRPPPAHHLPASPSIQLHTTMLSSTLRRAGAVAAARLVPWHEAGRGVSVRARGALKTGARGREGR